MNNGSYNTKYSRLSYRIEETDSKAIVSVDLEVDFPFKFIADKMALKLMEWHFEFGKLIEKYKETPHLEIAKMLLELKEGKKK